MTPVRWSDRMAAEWWLTAAFMVVLVMAMLYSGATEKFDNLAYDVLASSRTHDPDPDILLVTFDETSLREFGAWPWPRERQAQLITKLASGGPAVIVYDVLLQDPAPGDRELGAAMAKAGNVFLPLLLDVPGQNGVEADIRMPVKAMLDGAAGVGHVQLFTDADGVIRRTEQTVHVAGRSWPLLVEQARRRLQPGRPASRPDNTVLLPISGPAGTFPSISASAVLRGELAPEFVRGKALIVGMTAAGLGDNHPVPASTAGEVMPGIEVQANLLDGLLHDHVVTACGFAMHAFLALLPIVLTLFAIRFGGVGATIASLVAALLLTLAISAAALYLLNVWVAPTPSFIGILLLNPIWSWRRLISVNSYMSRELEQLRADPGVLQRLSPRADPVRRAASRETVLLADAIAELRAMRRFIGESLDQLPDAVWVVDDAGTIALSNQKALTVPGSPTPCPADSLKRPNIRTILDRMQPASGMAGIALWPPASDSDRREVSVQDGRIFDIHFARHRSEKQRSIGWIIRMCDITDIRVAEGQRDSMLNFLTHDLRSPQISILAITASTRTEDIQPDVAHRIADYAQRTLDLADGIVHLARAENLDFRPAPLDLTDIALEAADMLWPQARQAGITIAVIESDQELAVLGERSLLLRVLINLLDNAIKYHSAGREITCTLRVGKGAAGAESALCDITNQGDAIPEDKLAELFAPFKRGSHSRACAMNGSGAGLGLAFARIVAARHGGELSCVSENAGRTTFTLALPLLR